MSKNKDYVRYLAIPRFQLSDTECFREDFDWEKVTTENPSMNVHVDNLSITL